MPNFETTELNIDSCIGKPSTFEMKSIGNHLREVWKK